MALLPYSVRQVTQRSKGRRDRGDRGDRGELRLPSSAPSSRSAPSPSDGLRRRARLLDDVEPRPTSRRRVDSTARSTNGADEFDGRRPTRGRRLMKIVLRADVDNLGKKGDLVDVADGYARNFLVPRGLALQRDRRASRSRPTRCAATATPATAASARPRRRSPRSSRAARSRSRPAPAASGRLFGSVTSSDIADAVQTQTGVEIDRRKHRARRAAEGARRRRAGRPPAPRRHRDPARRGRLAS